MRKLAIDGAVCLILLVGTDYGCFQYKKIVAICDFRLNSLRMVDIKVCLKNCNFFITIG